MEMNSVMAAVDAEVRRAMEKFPPMHSAHEGYAVILEELDELKEWVWQGRGSDPMGGAESEAIQIAAMAIRYLVDVGGWTWE
jgi:hypothetical protein